MSNPSNIYAEKVFSEHPVALWSLDESVDYISLISEAERNASSPTMVAALDNVSCTFGAPSDLEKNGQPFSQSVAKKVKSVTTNANLLETMAFFTNASSPINISSLDQSQDTFSVSFYLKPLHPFTSSVEIGYFLASQTDLSDAALGLKQTFSSSVFNEWSMYSATFDIPETNKTYAIPYIAITYVNQTKAGGAYVPSEYAYVLNGLAIGQSIEQFSAKSLGVSATSLGSSDQTLFGATGYISANQYGLGEGNGKYLISGKKLLAKNTSIPMAYGSSNITRITPNPTSGKPSLVLPGNGMLHYSGRYNAYTFETWLRVDSRSYQSRKILGPVGNTNGLYVDGPFLRLQVGGSTGSHFVGEWYRPMLVDIRIALDTATLLINGEQVIEISFNTQDMILETDAPDYWGFYAYSDVPALEIDCPAIYPYAVPSIVAKRRFGYGQAVESPDGVNKSFGATTAFIDYSVADYTNNYHYPDMGRWSQGISENINTDGLSLSSPTVYLPDFVFSNSNYDEWFTEQSANTSEQFTFNSKPGFIRFNSLSVASQPTKGVYVVFSISSYSQNEKTIFKIVNKITGDEFRAVLLNDTVKYILKVRGVETLVDQKIGVILDAKTFIGISFDALSEEFGGDVLSFFNNSAQMLMFVAGDNSFTKMFDGNIYKVGVSTERNLAKVLDYFSVDTPYGEVDGGLGGTLVWFRVLDGGTPDSFEIDSIYDHIATYTLRSYLDYGVYSIDVDCDSYWQDYVPLSYFAQYIKNIYDQDYYDLDFLQFNIDYPVLPKFKRSYYDTEDSLVRSYVSFQLVETGATKQLNAFADIARTPQDSVVDATSDRHTSGWMNTAFEVVDGTIIYPPKDVPLTSYAIVTHIEMKIRGAIKNKIGIKKLQYASQAYNDNTSNPIGTKFNVPVYPYQKLGVYFDYKSKNPYRIYKGSTPHLYLTRRSGIEKLGDYDPLINRGFLINVNNKNASSYKVIGTQMFAFYGKDQFPSGEVKLFEIESDYVYVKVFMQPVGNSRKKARLYAFNAKTGELQTGVAFYINGNLVKTPVINANEWTSISLRFAEPLKFDNSVGAIRITGPVMVNNVSYYESSGIQEIERQSLRLWNEVAGISYDWDYWRTKINNFGAAYLWYDVLVLSSTQYYGVDPTNIYKAYTGTNKIVSGDSSILYLGGLLEYNITKEMSWSSSIVKPL